MKAVVNATPLIALAVIDRLDLLRSLFDNVIVPAEVYDEVVVQGAGKPGAEALAGADWLQVEASPPVPAIDPLLTGLDAGEIAVLLLARQIGPDWVLIDERQARRVAFALELSVKGTLGILLAAVLAGLLTRDEALEDLDRLHDTILSRHELQIEELEVLDRSERPGQTSEFYARVRFPDDSQLW